MAMCDTGDGNQEVMAEEMALTILPVACLDGEEEAVVEIPPELIIGTSELHAASTMNLVPQPRPPPDCFFFNTYNEVLEKISEISHSTVTSFVIARRHGYFNAPLQKQIEILSGLKKQSRSVRFSGHKTSQTQLLFDGTPYITLGWQTQTCHQGIDYGLRKKRRYHDNRISKLAFNPNPPAPRNKLQDSKKVGCPAKIEIAHILKFPSVKITEDTRTGRKRATNKLKQELQNANKFPVQEKFVMWHLSNHEGHPINNQEAGKRERLDPRVRDYIRKLFAENITSAEDIKRHVKCFVATELFPNSTDMPPEWRHRYYPETDIIHSCIRMLKKSTEEVSRNATTAGKRKYRTQKFEPKKTSLADLAKEVSDLLATGSGQLLDDEKYAHVETLLTTAKQVLLSAVTTEAEESAGSVVIRDEQSFDLLQDATIIHHEDISGAKVINLSEMLASVQ